VTPRLKKVLLALGIGLVLYAALGFLLAPRLVRSALLANLGKVFVTRPTLEKVRVNPFALSLTLKGFSVPDGRGKTALAFDKLYLRFSLLSPFYRAWTLDELRLEKPSVGLAILEDRSLNLLRMLKPQPAPADTGGEPPALLVRRLQLIDGNATFEDLSRTPALQKALIPIQVQLTDFSTRRDSRNAYSLQASTDGGEQLAWSGRFTTLPFTSQGELRVSRLRAATVEDFLDDALPFVLARGAIDFSAAYLLDAGKVPAELELSNMAVEARDLALVDRASGEEALAADSVVARGGAVRASQLEADLGTVAVGGARVTVWMDSTGVTNFQRWAEVPADTGPPWVASIPTVTMSRTSVEYQDRRLDPPAVFRMSDGRAEAKGFSTRPGTSVPFSVACSLGTTGRAEARGTLVPSTPSADLELDARRFDLRQIEPYVQVFARLDIRGGTADAKGRLRFNAFGPKGPLLRFAGNASSSGFGAVDQKVQSDFLSWKRLDLKGLQYDFLPSRVALREVVATQAYARVVVAPDLTSNVQALMVPPDSLPAAFRPSPDAPDTMAAAIDLVRVVDCSMYFADLSLRPNFATGIQGLNGTITELSSAQGAHAAIGVEGNVGPQSPVIISGTINPLNSRGKTDVGMKFGNIELTTFTPYSGKFMGYPIEKGKLDLDLRYVIEDRELRGENKILVRQLTLGDKNESPDATKLPVKFAIALLKDRNGDINLDLPVRGNLDDPKFSIWGVVLKIFLGLITKAVTSPFALFGAIFGGEAESSPAIRFAYGSADLDTTEARKLDALQKGLADRPALKLEVEETGEVRGDSLGLAAQRYEALLRTAARADDAAKPPDPAVVAAAAEMTPPGFEPARYAQLVTRAYGARFGKPPSVEGPRRKTAKGAAPDPATVATEAKRLALMDARLRSSVAVEPDELRRLRVERAQRVQGYLLRDTTIAPERVFIVADKGMYAPDSTGVRMGLTLTD
jgi:hypothetical protein